MRRLRAEKPVGTALSRGVPAGNRLAWIVSAAGRVIVLLLLAGVLQACATPPRLDAVPGDRVLEASVPGIPDARLFGDDGPEGFEQLGLESFHREKAYQEEQGKTGHLSAANYLVISGGGDKGAFGAGLIVGWTEAGDRPDFKLVTGISTGALIAPFAFLGPQYDARLKEVYTSISADNIYRRLGLFEGFFGEALTDTTPLFHLVARYADQAMLDDIARESARGRLLFISTTDLDAQRPVIWNIGAIAESGDPRALELFHKILVASASIPGLFPPVMIEVELDGRLFHEMHVDGGAMAQAFLYPPSVDVSELSVEHGVRRERHAYIIRNARLDPDWAHVERRTMSIVGRAIASLIHTQGVGDLYRMYLQTERDGVAYNLAHISRDFTAVPAEEFDTEFMRALFDHGYQLGRQGYPWQKYPPGYDENGQDDHGPSG